MAWAHVQDSPGGGAVAGAIATSVNVGAFGSAVTINNFVVVFAWGQGGATSGTPTAGQVTASDNGSTPNPYTPIAFKALPGPSVPGSYVAIFVAKITHNPSSGNLNPSISCSDTPNTVCVGCAAEFSGGSTTTDGSSSNDNTNNINNQPSCGSMSTTVANDLLLCAFGLNQASNLTGITAPSGYSTVGSTTSETDVAGGGNYKIASGTVSGNNPTWTVTGASTSSSEGWCACQVALEPAAAAVIPPPRSGQLSPDDAAVLASMPFAQLVSGRPTVLPPGIIRPRNCDDDLLLTEDFRLTFKF